MIGRTLVVLLSGASLAACTLAPTYERPALAVSNGWSAPASPASGVSAADLGWKEVYLDPRLRGVIDLALEENRDLRVAVLNVEKARALYGVQRSALVPGVGLNGAASRARTPGDLSATGSAIETEQVTATVGFSAYELDLFGRVRSLNASALQSFFAADENSRAAQISLVAETATAWLTLAADQDLLALARETLATREEALKLTRQRAEIGAASQLDVRQAETLTEQARADVAAFESQTGRDLNALRLLVGMDVPASLLPSGGLLAMDAAIREDLPAGLPSDVLVNRPDVLAAEHALRARNADIGAARAAFFPRISLTGQTGFGSTELSGLFGGGTGMWSFSPQISLPIFDGGANLANLRGARADRDIAVATYEKTVQVAFREVSDALTVRAFIATQIAAQERAVAAAAEAERLSRLRYEQGIDSYLILLDAQRTHYGAQQALISLKVAQASNLATLYRALGGGAWG
jgi:multidrug efflux system outer membrane protein